MPSAADDIATLLVDDLNEAEWSQVFEAAYLEVPDWSLDLGELNTLRVTVVDAEIEVSRADRLRDYHDVTLDVAVQKHVGNDDDEPRALKALCQEMLDRYTRKHLDAAGAKIWRAAYLAHKVPEHLRTKRVFSGVIRLTYRTLR
jgi:hypothetical protein